MGSILANRNKTPASKAIVLALLCACFTQQNIPIMSVDATNNVQIIYMRQRPLGEDPTVIIEKSHHRMLAAVLGSKEAVADALLYSYKHGILGFAAKLTESQAEMVAGILF
ncbi:hypothetical protein MRB53_025793 [Persea americana]|uniref:Uncharacterized protein n=1 Tax=Persea americana TaxID=3435 RepID=A0ACC2LG43_PERAE|nr:hypothetical protein MRB53_025793 [Persea americana]